MDEGVVMVWVLGALGSHPHPCPGSPSHPTRTEGLWGSPSPLQAQCPQGKDDKVWQRTRSYTDVLGQSDHPLVTFDPRGSLEQRAGRGLILGQRPQVWEVGGLPAKLHGACRQSRAGQGVSAGPRAAGPKSQPCAFEPHDPADSLAFRHLCFPICVMGP